MLNDKTMAQLNKVLKTNKAKWESIRYDNKKGDTYILIRNQYGKANWCSLVRILLTPKAPSMEYIWKEGERS